VSLYITHQILMNISQDTDQRLVNFKRAENVTTTTIRTDLTKETSQGLIVPAGASNMALAQGALTTVKLFYLETDRELTVKFNSEVTGHLVSPATGMKAKIFWEGTFTAITVSNAGTEDANVTYAVAG
jgi:hypothetical protein